MGDDAQLIPWDTSLIHTGMAKLQARLNAKPEPAEVKAINERIATLRKQVDAKKAEQQKLRNQREKWQEWRRANAEEKKLVAQLNEQLVASRPVRNPCGQRPVGREDLPVRERLRRDDQQALRHRRHLPGRLQGQLRSRCGCRSTPGSKSRPTTASRTSFPRACSMNSHGWC